MDNAAWTAVAAVAAAICTGVATYLTQKAASRAQATSAQSASRVAVEQGAFDRAARYYQDAMKRQDDEIKGLQDDVARLTAEVQTLRKESAYLRAQLAKR